MIKLSSTTSSSWQGSQGRMWKEGLFRVVQGRKERGDLSLHREDRETPPCQYWSFPFGVCSDEEVMNLLLLLVLQCSGWSLWAQQGHPARICCASHPCCAGLRAGNGSNISLYAAACPITGQPTGICWFKICLCAILPHTAIWHSAD